MAFADSFLDEIRARVPVSEVAAKRVRLKRSGRGELSGLCPFHDEKTPSFTVNDAKAFYHCFGCGAHGSAFDFLMQTEGLSFPEAVERLAGMAGLEMPARDDGPDERARREGRVRLYGLLEAAAAWFEDRLRRDGAAPRQVLEDRGIDGATAAQFRLGLAPESRDALKQALLARGYSEKELIAVGLLVAPEDGGETYDRFRNRLMFPITDRRGQVVAFGGRTLGAARAKYLNSPETEFFHKGSLLYNLAGARAASREAGTVLVAEGYTDVISMWRHGFRHAVAPLGTALTDNQLGELWRLAPEPVLCLDGDAAGLRAAVRAAENALPLLKPGHSLRFALLPAGEDPDSLLRGGGAKAFGELLAAALPLSQVLWRSAAAGDATTPERRAGVRQALFALADTIRDRSVRAYYRGHFAAQLDRAFGGGGGPRARVRARTGRGGPRLRPADGPGVAPAGTAARRERALLATLLNHPEILGEVLETAAQLRFETPELDRLCGRILEIAGRGDSLDKDSLRGHLNDTGEAAVADTLTRPGSGLVEGFVRPDASAGDALNGWRETLMMHRREDLRAERERAASRLADEGTEAAFDRVKALAADRPELSEPESNGSN